MEQQEKNKLAKIAVVLGTILSVFVFVKLINEIKTFSTIGRGDTPINTIVVSGDGEVYASPDIASLSFSVRDTKKTVAEAQAEVEKKIAASLAFLKESGVDEKDVQTTGTTFYPQYQYYDNTCRIDVGLDYSYCPPAKAPVITGYEMSETVSVKVRAIDNVGKLIAGLGNIGVTDLSGPNFAIDNEDVLKEEARGEAIAKAKAKAEALAKDLGVRLGDIVSFSESGNSPVYYYGKAEMGMGGAAPMADMSVSQGENKVVSNVTITYEIR